MLKSFPAIIPLRLELDRTIVKSIYLMYKEKFLTEEEKEDRGLLLLMQQANKKKVVSRKKIMQVLSDNKK